MLQLMTDKQTPTPDPSDAEVRLAVQDALPRPPEKLSPEDGTRLMQDLIAELQQKIAGWSRILDTDPANDTAPKCLASDQANLRAAKARLQEYQLQYGSRN